MRMCPECARDMGWEGYCKPCNLSHFEENFGNWTSGHSDIDRIIQSSQVEADGLIDVLEWIPYTSFDRIESIGKGGFGTVYKAGWSEGWIQSWDIETNKWKRRGYVDVALKATTFEGLINEMVAYRQCQKVTNFFRLEYYGITQDPETRKYIIVMELAKESDLRNFTKSHFTEITWKDRISTMRDIVENLCPIHQAKLPHGNFHPGNILKINKFSTRISDFGLSQKFVRMTYSKNEDGIYGVMPYVAPEVLMGRPHTTASDIYSFAMIMWELIFGRPPFGRVPHDRYLALRICKGDRPEITEHVPPSCAKLMRWCWNPVPEKRPTAEQALEIMSKWYWTHKQFMEAERVRKEFASNYDPDEAQKTHQFAIYASRQLPTVTENLTITYLNNTSRLDESLFPYTSRLDENRFPPPPHPNRRKYYQNQERSKNLPLTDNSIPNEHSFTSPTNNSSYRPTSRLQNYPAPKISSGVNDASPTDAVHNEKTKKKQRSSETVGCFSWFKHLFKRVH